MEGILMKPAAIPLAALLLCVPAFAQGSGKSEIFSAQQVREELATLAAQAAAAGSSGVTLADYGSHKLQISVRTTSGGAEIHAHWDDVMIVQQGSATLITGGSIVAPKTNPDGETKGGSIQGGKSQTISPGDIITVNAGVPHQILVPPGVTYSALVIKVKE
jgi:mannose-6-phosphate isomerase-like protein (cupin superfamily)